jgi:hypothetical protein
MMVNGGFLKVSCGALAILGLSLSGCSDEPAPQASPAPQVGESYYRDIKPLVDSKCAGCHQEGGVGPFPLTTFEEVSSRKDIALYAVESRSMPPWPPAQDCADLNHDRSLTDDEIAVLGRWVKAGAPAGDPKDAAPPVEAPRDGLSRVDYTLSMKESYTPKVTPDEYRCFLLDWPASSTKFVTGLNVVPGNRSMLHHMIAFLAKPDNVAQYQALDDADPAPGYECFGGPGGDAAASWVGGWAPGAGAPELPAGTGLEIPAGSKIVMQLHYNTLSTQAGPDQTSLEFMVEDTVEKPAFMMPFTNPSWVFGNSMDIPANSRDVVHSFTQDPGLFISYVTDGAISGDKPLTIYRAGLHMHTRGTKVSSEIIRADGQSACLLNIPRWNFHWQGMYNLKQAEVLNPGDKLKVECHYDNTTSNDMNWGEGTSDEMCLATFLVSE